MIKGKVIEYGMCSAHHHEELVKYVNEGIQQGWEMHGETFTTIQMNLLFFHQPMIKYGTIKKAAIKKKSTVKR